jgi:hypothetical protein
MAATAWRLVDEVKFLLLLLLLVGRRRRAGSRRARSHVPNTREARRCSILNLSILVSNGWRGTDKRLCNGPVHLPVIGWT